MPRSSPLHGDTLNTADIIRERDLYLRLLNLGQKDDLEAFLEEALILVTELVRAHQGYIELTLSPGDKDAPRWSLAHGFSSKELDGVRLTISRGIMAVALHSGQTVVTRSASLDRRFEARNSVREGRIEAVICAPIGAGAPIGVLYLQRRLEPGPFSDDDRLKVELFARHVAPYADRLVQRRAASTQNNPTRPFRDLLRLEGIVGRSSALADVLREVSLVAPLDIDVLLTGESGTGKTQIARAIHDNSARTGRPFVELNCAAIPETLVESELFGAVPGAHSTASRRIEGKLAAAQGGTLLLDEIGELSVGVQAKLLQLMQSRMYYPLGSTKPVRADLRVIGATNVDLEAYVKDGRFREDLYYRLAVLPIRLPALAERREDIPDLANHFCATACARHRLPRLTLSHRLLDALSASEWPGNIRQLANAVEAATIRAGGARLLQVETTHLCRSIELACAREREPHAPLQIAEGVTFQAATRRFQAKLLRDTLEATGWNACETATRLEITRSHVYALIRGFSIERPR